jgi:adenylate cyclase
MHLATMGNLADIGSIPQQQVEVATREWLSTPCVAAGRDPFLGEYSPLGKVGLQLPDTAQLEVALKSEADYVDIDPDDYRSPLLVMNALHSLGRHDEEVKLAEVGLERAERALRLHPENSDPAQLGAIALIVLGQHVRAKEWADRALLIDSNDNNALYNVACVYSLLGEADRAIDLLEPYLQTVGPHMRSWFKNDSDFDPIRSHPRYQNLVKMIE